MKSSTDRYYPETLIRVYFRYCKVNDVKPSFEDMNNFIDEIQEYYQTSESAKKMKWHLQNNYRGISDD